MREYDLIGVVSTETIYLHPAHSKFIEMHLIVALP